MVNYIRSQDAVPSSAVTYNAVRAERNGYEYDPYISHKSVSSETKTPFFQGMITMDLLFKDGDRDL